MAKLISLCSGLLLLATAFSTGLARARTADDGSQSRSKDKPFTAQSITRGTRSTKKSLAQAPSKAPPAPGQASHASNLARPDCRTLVLLNYKLRQRGDYQSAEKVLQEAMKQATLDADKILVHNALGGLYMQTQNDTESEANFRKALALLEKTAKPDSLDMATILDNLSVVCSSSKKFGEAESLNSRAITIYKKNKDAPNATLDLITVLGNRGFILSRQGKHKEALESYEEAVAICQSGSEVPPSLYATMIDNLGSAYFNQGEFEKAEHARIDALALFESSQGQNHPETIKARRNLAAVYIKEARWQEAADLLTKAVEVLKASGSVNKNILNSCISDLEYCQVRIAAKKMFQEKSDAAEHAKRASESKSAPEDKPEEGGKKPAEKETAEH